MAEAGSIYTSRWYSWAETMRMPRAYVPERYSGKPPHLIPHFVLLGSIRVRSQLTNDKVSYCRFP